MKIIINADDFGASHRINSAITEAFKKGFVTSTTIMVNMPDFNEAVKLAKENGFLDKVGIHLNFFAGEPLSEKIKHEPLLYNKKTNQLTSKYINKKKNTLFKFFLPKHLRQAIAEEANAQICKYINSGFTEGHLDSHGHAHTLPAFYFAIRKTLKSNGIKTVRKSLNLYLKRPFWIKIYKNIFNHIISLNFKTTQYFTSVTEFTEVIKSGFSNNAYTCEIMLHPCHKSGKLINNESIDFEQLLTFTGGHTLISYNEI